MLQSYRLIWKEEGILRGLYAGVTPAMLGSIPGTTLYFGTYEFTKRTLTANAVPEFIAHLCAGSFGDLAASFIYVPSEVLKTRMQLQGRYNNPHFISGYNYRNTWHATKIVRTYHVEGINIGNDLVLTVHLDCKIRWYRCSFPRFPSHFGPRCTIFCLAICFLWYDYLITTFHLFCSY